MPRLLQTIGLAFVPFVTALVLLVAPAAAAVVLGPGESVSFRFDLKSDPAAQAALSDGDRFIGALYAVDAQMTSEFSVMTSLTVADPSNLPKGRQTVENMLTGPKSGTTFFFSDLLAVPLPGDLLHGMLTLTRTDSNEGDAVLDRFLVSFDSEGLRSTGQIDILQQAAVPLPASAVLLVGGLAALVAASRRRKPA